MVIFNFIFDGHISLFSRVKRPSKPPKASSTLTIQDADDDAMTARGYAETDIPNVR